VESPDGEARPKRGGEKTRVTGRRELVTGAATVLCAATVPKRENRNLADERVLVAFQSSHIPTKVHELNLGGGWRQSPGEKLGSRFPGEASVSLLRGCKRKLMKGAELTNTKGGINGWRTVIRFRRQCEVRNDRDLDGYCGDCRGRREEGKIQGNTYRSYIR